MLGTVYWVYCKLIFGSNIVIRIESVALVLGMENGRCGALILVECELDCELNTVSVMQTGGWPNAVPSKQSLNALK